MLDCIKALFRKAKTAPPPEFHDAELGVLTGDSALWSGTITQNGTEICFTVAGTPTVPDQGLLDGVRNVVRKFPDIESAGLAFLRAQLADIWREEFPNIMSMKFTISSLTFLWPDKPDCFYLEWFGDTDDDCLWIVHYESGKPKEAGIED
jgi:hypothetical protein